MMKIWHLTSANIRSGKSATFSLFILIVIAGCFIVLLLHGGCREVSGIREPGASLAVPLILLVSGWLTKVILVALM